MSWTEEEDQKRAEAQQNRDQNDAHLSSENNNDRNLGADSAPKKSDGNDTASLFALVEKISHENLVEKRRARRWKIFFRLLSLLIIILIIGVWAFKGVLGGKIDHQNTVALIPMEGVIGNHADIDANEYVQILDDAYSNPNLQGVVIEMNSPGGSPVHSGIIYDAIRKKEKRYPQIPVIVVVGDMAASGGYYIASAANDIYANRASLVGSIGVISSGFDASGLIKKLGVERRTFTAGRNKDFLDPFAPMTNEGKKKWQAVLDQTHQQFIHAVKEGRGDRLTITDDVFSGMVFTGEQAVSIGLVDGLASVNDILQSKFPNDKTVTYGPKQDPLDEFAKKFGVEFATKLISTVKLQ